MEEKDKTFTYAYSSKQQEEIKSIRQKYIPHEESKMELLRKLDKSAEKRGTIVSIIIGTISTLIFGIGMCCVLVWTDFFIPGIVIGIIGIIGIILAFPIFSIITKKEREKLAPQIIKLSDELTQQK